jgi:16S rRNA (cytosine967-C5)-methyltransferase
METRGRPLKARAQADRSGTRPISAARACALTVLRRVFEDDAWADRAFHGEARKLGLDARDRALAMRLAYGAVQRRATLDHLATHFTGRPTSKLEPLVLAGLRLGLYQLAFLDRVPAHAAVGETVELVKAGSAGGARLVNAVLRRAAGTAPGLVAALPDATPAEAALRHSHPEWIVRLWWEALGPEDARALLAADNEPAEGALRANTLRITPAALLAHLGAGAHAAPGPPELPEGVVLDGAFDAFGDPGWARGLHMPQSRAAMAVGRLLGPRPGERVLDLCAAPGGKTTHLAALMEGRGEVVAVERHPGRADALRRTVRRMGAQRVVSVLTADAGEPGVEPDSFDRVLVDPPCSDLGTLASRPDARWRKAEDLPARLATEQARILRAGLDALRPGGVLVYSTCTISPDENEAVVRRVLGEREDVEVDDLRPEAPLWQHHAVPRFLQTLPHRHGTEGFFVARLRRREAA